MYHNGDWETLAQLRTLFWIPKGRQTESNRKIPAVQKIKGLSYPPPQTNLTELRVIGRRELGSTGDDLYGSVHTKIYWKSRQMTGKNIIITTCATSRRIHLEELVDNSPETYLQGRIVEEEFQSWWSQTMERHLRKDYWESIMKRIESSGTSILQ